jgi:hypothetical protein
VDAVEFYASGKDKHIHNLDIGRVFLIEHVMKSKSTEPMPSYWLLLKPTQGSEKIVTRIPADIIGDNIISRVNKYWIRTQLILRGVSWFGAPLLEFIEEGWSAC